MEDKERQLQRTQREKDRKKAKALMQDLLSREDKKIILEKYEETQKRVQDARSILLVTDERWLADNFRFWNTRQFNKFLNRGISSRRIRGGDVTYFKQWIALEYLAKLTQKVRAQLKKEALAITAPDEDLLREAKKEVLEDHKQVIESCDGSERRQYRKFLLSSDDTPKQLYMAAHFTFLMLERSKNFQEWLSNHDLTFGRRIMTMSLI